MAEITENPLKLLRRQAVQKIQDRTRENLRGMENTTSATPSQPLPEPILAPQEELSEANAPLGSGEMAPSAPGEPAHPSLLDM
jgi:hypothetical protein